VRPNLGKSASARDCPTRRATLTGTLRREILVPHLSTGTVSYHGQHARGLPMNVVCPQCQNSITLDAATQVDVVACPACGSSFRIELDATATWHTTATRNIGRFEILGVLGQGAFGTVYKARDPNLDRVVALKVPRADQLAGPREVDRFLREARSVAQLRHPAIVPVHEAGQAESVPYLVSKELFHARIGVAAYEFRHGRRSG
jgi:hypothetical protein